LTNGSRAEKLVHELADRIEAMSEEIDHYYRLLEEYPTLCKELDPPESTREKFVAFSAARKKRRK
jgi:hypothetical protein